MNHAVEKKGKKMAEGWELMMNRGRGWISQRIKAARQTHRPASVNGACLFHSGVIVFLANTAGVLNQDQPGLFIILYFLKFQK